MNNDNRTDIDSNSKAPAWPSWLGFLPLIAGLVIGGWVLLGPLGIWLGMWEFGTGLPLVVSANNIALWVAGGCAVVGVVAVGLSIMMSTGGVGRNATFAVFGVIIALLAYYVPQSYNTEGAPAIHDVSTNTVDPPQFVDVVPLRGEGTNSVVYGEGLVIIDGPPPRPLKPGELAEIQARAFPDITTKRYNQPKEEVFARALRAAEQLGWELVAQVPEEGRIEATDTTFWFRFKDDVVIKITTEGNETVVDARSLSRVGIGDFGKNAARLRAFFEALDS